MLHLAFYGTSIVFWPLGALVVAWFLAARLSPHLGVAAFAALAPVVVYLTPTAVGDGMTYEYALAVATGATVLALASLAAAIAPGGDVELDRPHV